MLKELFISLLSQMAIIGITAYIFAQTKMFKKLVIKQVNFKDKLLLVLFFGILSSMGTFMGIPINGALANIRAIGAIVAGLLGGPWIGLGAGLIAGTHRYFVGGFTAFACGLSTTVEGLFGGIIHRTFQKEQFDSKFGFMAGLVGEAIQMLIILLVAKPFSEALALVKIIALPMMLSNALGIAIFMNIVKNIRCEQERIGAIQAQKALNIANETLTFLRKGLNYKSAKETAKIIMKHSNIEAVAITDTEKILAHVGEGSDHHLPGKSCLTKVTREAIRSGEMKTASSFEEIGCSVKNCKLYSAVVVPLKNKEEIIGTIKLYHSKGKKISQLDIELAAGLAQLLSTQIELAKLEEQAKLAATAELKALQAQINPHFLFNALNTISSFCRTNPETARKLILQLSDFFRKTLKKEKDFATLAEELQHVNSYLTIEKARYGERLKVEQDIPSELLSFRIPVFTLQPLIENSIKHGLSPKMEGGTIKIKARSIKDNLVIIIRDTGVGIPAEKLNKIMKKGFGTGTGIGLSNVNERLKSIYGEEYGLTISSIVNEGTVIKITIPKKHMLKVSSV